MKEPKIKVSCTWGDGPDVMFTLNDHPFILYEDPCDNHHFTHGVVKKGSLDLTSTEALELAHQLLTAARAAESLDAELEEYEKRERMKDQECTCDSGYVKAEGPDLRCMICKGKVKS